MYLPDYVLNCIEPLENAGFSAYAVGGCVRDACLGLTPHDYDLCTSALPEQTEAVFADRKLVLAGKKHGTVGVVTDFGVVEITTFRREGTYGDNRHPDWVEFVPEITEDLARRDFTVNAMAYSPTRGFADPFAGREDLEKGILRAVGDPVQRFREDSLRILRGVRFASRYGLTVAEETKKAMLSEGHLMDNLARERVYEELCKLLVTAAAEDLIEFAPVLAFVIPELEPLIGFDQRSPHHAYDLFTHVAHVVAGVPKELTLRWAALLHDIGKIPTFTRDETGRGHFYGHAPAGAEMADAVLRRLKAPTALREQAVLLIEKHMTKFQPEKKTLRRQAGRLGLDFLDRLLSLQEADMGSKGTGKKDDKEQFRKIRELLEEIRSENACLTVKDLAVNGHDLMALGCQGKEIGEKLNALLELVLDEKLPNEKAALLAHVQNDR
ncbi:MAG: HD domain-containing protein [Oscillospiraceae bacterium]|nr:HD domain-containing protein [Oscillospiraceae bacterium]MBQ7130304.1 HD domain-containing protein [Oscillospiraceae bacterium]